MVNFDAFQLPEPVLRALADMKFETASPIQEAVLPVFLAGRDLIGQAQTGTGKTAAFGIPLVKAAIEGQASIVLVPTRELATQVAAELDRIGQHAHVRALPIYGGTPISQQIRAIESDQFAIIVATPGRLRDHIARGTLDPGAASIIVLDEADEMLDMGFIEEVEAILDTVSPERQTALFSATMAEPVIRLTERYLKNPEYIQVSGSNDSIAAENTVQLAVQVENHEKLDALLRILAVERPTGTLVFRHTRETVDELVAQLERKGLPAEALHGGMAQQVRENVLARFRTGAVRVLVATNVAARGLDVDRLSHVVNYDAPREPDAYVHRIGRTGRAGRAGRAFLFVGRRDVGRLRGIERVLGARLGWFEIPTDADVAASVDTGISSWLEARDLDADSLEREATIIDKAVTQGADLRLLAANLLRTLAKHESLGSPALDMRRDTRQSVNRGDQGQPRPRDNGPRLSPSDAVPMAVNVGHEDGVRPGDLVGALANEGGLTGSQVGRIDILPRMSVVEIPADSVDEVLSRMGRSRIRGRDVSLRVAEGWSFRPARGAQAPMRPQRRY